MTSTTQKYTRLQHLQICLSFSLSHQPITWRSTLTCHQEGEETAAATIFFSSRREGGKLVAVNTLSQTVEESSQLPVVSMGLMVIQYCDLFTTDRQAAPTADSSLNMECTRVRLMVLQWMSRETIVLKLLASHQRRKELKSQSDNSTEPKKVQPSPIQISDPLSTDSLSLNAPVPEDKHTLECHYTNFQFFPSLT